MHTRELIGNGGFLFCLATLFLVSWATPVSMPVAFEWLYRFYGYAVSKFNFVEGYAVHVSMAKAV